MLALTCALVVVMTTVTNADLITLSSTEKQAVLDAHNFLRAQTALGLTPGQPPSANMPALEWDDRLETSAGNWVGQCIAGHDSGDARALTGYNWVGQNWAGGYSKNYSSYVVLWFDEYKGYTFDSKACSGVCGHYTQVVWAKTTLVGCAAASCSDYPIYFVCNYATGGNFNNEFPYVKGTPGSQCVGDYSLKQKGLCVRSDQCSGSDCVCTLTSCVNGVFDAAKCKCVCPDGYYGDKCEKICQDDTAAKRYCDSYGTGICVYTGYDVKCAKTCNMCKGTITRDPNVTNRDKVKCRSP